MKSLGLCLLLFFATALLDIPQPVVPPAPIDSLHAATHHIEQSNGELESDSCSATAIGPHALLTAAHCQLGTDEVTVDGKVTHIIGSIYDHHDHVILIVDLSFEHYLPVKEHTATTEWVVMWGNPGHSKDVYRTGVYLQDEDGMHVYQLPIFPGDSGAGVITKDGSVIDVVSLGDRSAHAACLPLSFTPEQLLNASK